MYRTVEKTDIVGKTVQEIDNRACNQLKLVFTDGTELLLETCYVGVAGLYAVGVWDTTKLKAAEKKE